MESLLMHPLVVLFFLAPLGAGVTFITNILIDEAKKARAYRRLKNDPYVYLGARMCRIKGAADVPVVNARCYISKLSFGRMEVTVDDPSSDEHGCLYTFKGREFENLIPVFSLGGH